jgi:hypothetical protein
MGAYNFYALNQCNHPYNNGTKKSFCDCHKDEPRRNIAKVFPFIAAKNPINPKTNALQQIQQLTLTIQANFMLKKPNLSIYLVTDSP